MKKGKNKKILSKLLIIVCIIIVLLIILFIYNYVSNKPTYTVTPHSCNGNAYTRCEIKNSIVNVNIGGITCGYSLTAANIIADKNMNVIIRVKEKRGLNTQMCQCIPYLTIEFDKKVNSVTLLYLNGKDTIIDKCEGE